MHHCGSALSPSHHFPHRPCKGVWARKGKSGKAAKLIEDRSTLAAWPVDNSLAVGLPLGIAELLA